MVIGIGLGIRQDGAIQSVDFVEATGQTTSFGVGNRSRVSCTLDIDSRVVFHGVCDVFGVRNRCHRSLALPKIRNELLK